MHDVVKLAQGLPDLLLLYVRKNGEPRWPVTFAGCPLDLREIAELAKSLSDLLDDRQTRRTPARFAGSCEVC